MLYRFNIFNKKNKTKLEDHNEIVISGNKVIYNNKIFDLDKEIGMSIYVNSDGSKDIITIRDDIGERFWNK